MTHVYEETCDSRPPNYAMISTDSDVQPSLRGSNAGTCRRILTAEGEIAEIKAIYPVQFWNHGNEFIKGVIC